MDSNKITEKDLSEDEIVFLCRLLQEIILAIRATNDKTNPCIQSDLADAVHNLPDFIARKKILVEYQRAELMSIADKYGKKYGHINELLKEYNKTFKI